MRTHITSLLPLVSLATALPQSPTSTTSSLPTATPYYTFPVNATDGENLALRSNGGILLNNLAAPQVLYIDSASLSSPPAAIATIPAPATGLLGIAELEDDVFYVATEEFDATTLVQVNGTGKIWRLDLSGLDACEEKDGAVTPELVASVKDSQVLNGVAALKGRGALLVADSYAGLIWRIDVATGDASVAIQDALTAPDFSKTLPIGANGVHVQGGYAYYTNSAQQLYARVPIDADGYATAPSEVLVKGAGIPGPDDFAFAGEDGAAYIADATLTAINFYDGAGGIKPVVAAGTRPTAVRLGGKIGQEGVGYFSTAGNATVGGGIETFRY